MISGTGVVSEQEFKRYTVSYGGRRFIVYSNAASFEHNFENINRWIKHLAKKRQWFNYQVSICDTTPEEATRNKEDLFETRFQAVE